MVEAATTYIIAAVEIVAVATEKVIASAAETAEAAVQPQDECVTKHTGNHLLSSMTTPTTATLHFLSGKISSIHGTEGCIYLSCIRSPTQDCNYNCLYNYSSQIVAYITGYLY